MEPAPMESVQQTPNMFYNVNVPHFDEHENSVDGSKIDPNMHTLTNSLYLKQELVRDSLNFPNVYCTVEDSKRIDGDAPVINDNCVPISPGLPISGETTATLIPIYADDFDLDRERSAAFCSSDSPLKVTDSSKQAFPNNGMTSNDSTKVSEALRSTSVNNSSQIMNSTPNLLPILDEHHHVHVQPTMTEMNQRASSFSKMKKQKTVQLAVELHPCGKCGKKYRHVASLKNHMQKHDTGVLKPKRYQCSLCSYSSQYSRNVHKHMSSTHSGAFCVHSKDLPIKLSGARGRKTVQGKQLENVFPEIKDSRLLPSHTADASSFNQTFVSAVQPNVYSQRLDNFGSTMGMQTGSPYYTSRAMIASGITTMPQATGNPLHELLTQQTKFTMEPIPKHTTVYTLASSPLRTTLASTRTSIQPNSRTKYQQWSFPSFGVSSTDGSDITYSVANAAAITNSADIYSFPGSKPYATASSFDRDGLAYCDRECPMNLDNYASLSSANIADQCTIIPVSRPSPPKSFDQPGYRLERQADTGTSSVNSNTNLWSFNEPTSVSFSTSDTELQHSLNQQLLPGTYTSYNEMYISNADRSERFSPTFNNSKVGERFGTSDESTAFLTNLDSQDSYKTTKTNPAGLLIGESYLCSDPPSTLVKQNASMESEIVVGETLHLGHLTPETDAFLDDLQDVLTRHMVQPKRSTPKEAFDNDLECLQGSENQSAKHVSGSVASFQGLDSGLECWSSGSSGGGASVWGSQETPRLRALSPFSNTPKQAPLSASSTAESFILNVNDGTTVGPPTDLSVQDVNAVLDYNVTTAVEQSISDNSSSCTVCPQTLISFRLIRSNAAQPYSTSDAAMKPGFSQQLEHVICPTNPTSDIQSQPTHGTDESIHFSAVVEPQQLPDQTPVSELIESTRMQTSSPSRQFPHQSTLPVTSEPVVDPDLPVNVAHSYHFDEQGYPRMNKHELLAPSSNQTNQLSNIPFQHTAVIPGSTIKQAMATCPPTHLYGSQSVQLPHHRNPTNYFYPQFGYPADTLLPSRCSEFRSVANNSYSGLAVPSNSMENTHGHVYPQNSRVISSDPSGTERGIWPISHPQKQYHDYPQNVYLNPLSSVPNRAQHTTPLVSTHPMYNPRQTFYGSDISLQSAQNQLYQSYPSQPVHQQPILHTINYGSEKCLPTSKFFTARSATAPHKFPHNLGPIEYYQGYGQFPCIGSSQELYDVSVHGSGRFVKFGSSIVHQDQLQDFNNCSSMEGSSSMKNLAIVPGMEYNSNRFIHHSVGSQNEPISSVRQADGTFHHPEHNSDISAPTYQLR